MLPSFSQSISHTHRYTHAHSLCSLSRPSHKSHLQILVAGVARAVELLAEPSFIIQNNCQKDLTTFRYSSRERKKNLVRYRISKTEIIFSDNSNKKNSNCRKKVFFRRNFEANCRTSLSIDNLILSSCWKFEYWRIGRFLDRPVHASDKNWQWWRIVESILMAVPNTS